MITNFDNFAESVNQLLKISSLIDPFEKEKEKLFLNKTFKIFKFKKRTKNNLFIDFFC